MAGGRKQALFKPLLFAEQDLDDIVADIAPQGGALADAVAQLRAGKPGEAEVVLTAAMLARPDEVGGWHHLLFAAAQDRQGKRAPMAKRLRNLAGFMTESRIRLLAWSALRRRGEDVGAPPDRVEGVVTEVEVGGGVDTLAAYADGTARLLLHTGARVVWDAPDERLAPAIRAIIDAAGALAPPPPAGRLPGEPGPGQARLTLLTPGGPRAAEEPLATIWREGAPWAALFGASTTLLEQIVELAGWDKPKLLG
jgi:hypothetical protein